MTKKLKVENIVEVRFNVYDGSRSDIPSVFVDVEFDSFGHGDCFGHDGKCFWIDLNQDLNEFDDVSDTDTHNYNLIKKVVEDNF